MTLRLPYFDLSREALGHLRAAGASLENGTLGAALIELVYLRVSQINGCAFCLSKHTRALRAMHHDERQLDELAGWHVSTRFSARERAALAWAEALTEVAATRATDESFEPLRAHFSDQEISDLTFAIAHMNALNRLAIGMRQ